jgi:hypothetical protein
MNALSSEEKITGFHQKLSGEKILKGFKPDLILLKHI